jgi:hypothetical protein
MLSISSELYNLAHKLPCGPFTAISCVDALFNVCMQWEKWRELDGPICRVSFVGFQSCQHANATQMFRALVHLELTCLSLVTILVCFLTES